MRTCKFLLKKYKFRQIYAVSLDNGNNIGYIVNAHIQWKKHFF